MCSPQDMPAPQRDQPQGSAPPQEGASQLPAHIIQLLQVVLTAAQGDIFALLQGPAPVCVL